MFPSRSQTTHMARPSGPRLSGMACECTQSSDILDACTLDRTSAHLCSRNPDRGDRRGHGGRRGHDDRRGREDHHRHDDRRVRDDRRHHNDRRGRDDHHDCHGCRGLYGRHRHVFHGHYDYHFYASRRSRR